MQDWVFHIGVAGTILLVWYKLFSRVKIRAQERGLSERVLAISPPSVSLNGALVDLFRLDRDRPVGILGQKRLAEKLDMQIQRANLPIEVTDLFYFCAAAMVLVGYFLFNLPIPLYVKAAVTMLAGLAPLAVIHKIGCVRKDRFLNQLTMAIDVLRASLLSGHSIVVATQSVSEEMPDPCGQEFKQVMQRINLGETLATAMGPTAKKFGSFELEFVRSAIDIHHETGGNLASLLEKCNYSLRERLKLRQKIEAITAHSQLTAIILGLTPPVIVIGFKVFNPQYLAPLFTTEIGHNLLLMAIVMHVSGVTLALYLSNAAER